VRILSRLYSHVVCDDPAWNHWCERGQARTFASRAACLLAYLLPGVLAYGLINVEPVFRAGVALTGADPLEYQYVLFVAFTWLWHIVLPVGLLRWRDGLAWREVGEFLGLHRFRLREPLLYAPLAFAASVLLSLPWMLTAYTPLQAWLGAQPALAIPAHSMFASAAAFYGASPLLLALMLIGNFVGEEVYFRGYLMKKTAFLGRANWFVGSVLFAVYHLWQVPQTWPLLVPTLFFGLLMQARKNLYALIAFHAFFNVFGYPIYNVWLGLGA
jgi:membrane protease YdiL (CAAX protease family)